jgi:hypothetical protein
MVNVSRGTGSDLKREQHKEWMRMKDTHTATQERQERRHAHEKSGGRAE